MALRPFNIAFSIGRDVSPDGNACMQDQDLRRTAETLWNVWLDLSYAFADLNNEDDSASARLGIGAGIERLRLVAETVERIAASADIDTAALHKRQPAL